MDDTKMKYLKQSQTKVYNCTFQLDIIELIISLRFPCKFFVQWKTNNSKKVIRTEGLVQNISGKAIFNKKLSIQVDMLYDDSKNVWIRKDSSINVYLVTKNKPDSNQLTGRINIDLSKICENSPYQRPVVQPLTYSSSSASLKFSLTMKYSIASKKPVGQIDLLQYNDHLYLLKNQDSLSKSKSLDYLKINHNTVSPVYQVNQNSIKNYQQAGQNIPLKFPLSKLQSFGRETAQVDDQDQSLRMTLGGQRKLSKQQYDLLIEDQAQGTKKSNLIIIPDMRKSHVEEDDSIFQTEQSKKTSQDDFVIDIQTPTLKNNNKVKQNSLKKTGSQKHCLKRQDMSQSDVDIVVDIDSKTIIQNDKNGIKNSINSSKSFSLSRFKAHYEGSSQQNFYKTKSPKQSMTSVQITSGFQNFANQNNQNFNNLNGKQNVEQIKAQNNIYKPRVKQLQTDIRELIKILSDTKQKLEKTQLQKNTCLDRIHELCEEKKYTGKKIQQLQKKLVYQSQINQINCQKLKQVRSELTVQKRKSIGLGESRPSILLKQTSQKKIQSLNQKITKLEAQKQILKGKLYKRDEIQLQNQIKIQQLQEQLINYRNKIINNLPATNHSTLNVQSKITQQTKSFGLSEGGEEGKEERKQKQCISLQQENIEKLQLQNISFKIKLNDYYNKNHMYEQRDSRMRQNITIIESQFTTLLNQLILKQKTIIQKDQQIQTLKNKIITFNSIPHPTTLQQQKELMKKSREIKKQEELLQFCQSQILFLEEQLAKSQKLNKQLSEKYNKLQKENNKFQTTLGVIKEQESYRETLGGSGQTFFHKSLLILDAKQENIINSYKQALSSHYTKRNTQETIEFIFTQDFNDLKCKFFEELDRCTKIINQIFIDNQILTQQVIQIKQEKLKIKKNLTIKLEDLQTKVDIAEGFQRISPTSSGITPNKSSFLRPEDDKIDRLSAAKKKRSPLGLNTESHQSRQVEKLKSIIYDKKKQMSDLIASYQKLKLQKQTQYIILKNKQNYDPCEVGQRQNDDDQLVHDILDLQIRLNKEKQHKHQIMEQLQVRKSLNRSQQMSQYVQQTNCVDLSTIYRQLRELIKKREKFITKQQPLNRLVKTINQLEENSQKVNMDYKLVFAVEEKSRAVSRQLQKMKSTLFKINIKDIQSMQYKSQFATILKPSQSTLNELLAAVEEMVQQFG